MLIICSVVKVSLYCWQIITCFFIQTPEFNTFHIHLFILDGKLIFFFWKFDFGCRGAVQIWKPKVTPMSELRPETKQPVQTATGDEMYLQQKTSLARDHTDVRHFVGMIFSTIICICYTHFAVQHVEMFSCVGNS